MKVWVLATEHILDADLVTTYIRFVFRDLLVEY